VTRKTASELLAEARAGLRRLDPHAAQAAAHDGALIVDTRDGEDRGAEGVIPGSIHVPLSVLEWRADPASASHDASFDRLDRLVVLVCNDGYSSSLAAARLQQLGYAQATDVDGGFRAWKQAGLRVEASARPEAPTRELGGGGR
jgi:rhodanese-related sulfurtransferase